jgi:BASS family bile acid:Na+ symporter
MKLLLRLIESYILIVLLAVGVGLAYPSAGIALAGVTTVFLQIIFFLSSLKLDLRILRNELRQFRTVALVNLYMLVLFPIVTYLLAKLFVPDYALPLLILASMPAGMTSPLLTEIVGGSVSLSLVLTATTSLLAPITIPLVMKLLVGATVEIPVMKMFTSLLLVIVVPFLLAQIVRRLMHEHIKASYTTFKPISIVLLGLLIMSVIAQRAADIRGNLNVFAVSLVILVALFALHHVIGYWGVPGLRRDQRLASTVCLTYMNFTLAIYVASKFFPDPRIIIPVVLSVFPWSIGIVPFRAFMARAAAKRTT